MERLSKDAEMRYRMGVLLFMMLVCILIIVVRQFYLQFSVAKTYTSRGDNQQNLTRSMRTTRGSILDRNGKVLATSSDRGCVGVRPWKIRDLGYMSTVLSETLDIKKSDLDEDFRKYHDCFFYLKRPATDAQCQALLDWKYAQLKRMNALDPNYDEDPLEGIDVAVEKSDKRFYPQGKLASHLLGFVGDGGEGLEGIEGYYNAELAGQSGEYIDKIDVRNASVASELLPIKEMVPSHDIVLTIDSTIQFITERSLDQACRYWQADGGVCMIMDVASGDVLASAVWPDFSPLHYEKTDAKLRRNRAFTDAYEPGSVFKVFTAAAVLKNGATPNSVYSCNNNLCIDGSTIGNSHDDARGVETMADIIKYSYNTGTAVMALDIGKEKLAKTLYDFGFGLSTNCGVSGEGEGILGDYRDWSQIDTATRSYGQAATVTPIQLVSAMQAIANNGVRMQPHVIKAVLDDYGQPIPKYAEEFKVKSVGKPINNATSRELISIMEGVVNDGTGVQAAVNGYKVAGKTGTANVVDPVHGGYAPDVYISSFLGIAPADNPRIVMLVKLENCKKSYYGGAVAGPVFRSVCSQVLPYLGISPQSDYKQNTYYSNHPDLFNI